MSANSANANGGTSETSPLLGKDNGPKQPSATGENVEAAAQEGQEDQQDDSTPMVEEPGTWKLSLIFASIWLGVFLNAMDSTIVAALALPISNSFESGNLIAWLMSGYLIANAGFQPISGKLTDIYGRRAGCVFANVFFFAGNLICGLAQSESVMITGRIIAGIGGGCLNTVATFIVTDLVPLRRRGMWQGVGNLAFGVGAGIGGLVGGAINDYLDWRWAFLLQCPLTVLSCIAVIFTVKIPIKDTDKARIKRVDFLGAFALVASLVLLLLGLNSGGNIVPWKHPLVYVSMPLAAVILVFFVFIEDRIATEPVIPVRLLLRRTVASGCLTNWLVTMAYYSYVFYGQIYFQAAQGLSTTEAGLHLLPNAAGLAIGSLGTGFIMRRTGKYYILNVFIEGLFVLATALMFAFFDLNTASWPSYIIFLMAGIGYGGMLTITLIALISAVDHKDQAVITSASYAARSTGSTIGIAIVSAVFQNMLKARLQKEFKHVEGGEKIIQHLRDNVDYIKSLPSVLEHKALVSYMAALKGVWATTLGLAALGAVASLAMRQHKLHTNLDRK